MSRIGVVGVVACVVACGVAVPARAATGEPSLDFASGWEISGDAGGVESWRGQAALRLGTGRAIYRAVALQDGSIEFDIAMPSARSFAYLQFRMAGDHEHEEIYFRPHKSGLPDALQYSPVFAGVSQWQLFHGPAGTAAVALPAETWIHVRLDLSGSRAAVYVGGAAEPALVIPRLARAPVAGYVALRGFLPQGTPTDWAARFANLVVKPGRPLIPPPAVEPLALPAGTLTRWELSPSFPVESLPVEEPPAPVGDWLRVESEPEGFVIVDRHRERPAGRGASGVVARVRLHAERPGARRLQLGFSDWISVFLNGNLLFTGAAPYSFDAPRRDGLLTPDDYAVSLPLEAGDNELLLVVSDVFGGWGFSGRLPDPSGLRIEP